MIDFEEAHDYSTSNRLLLRESDQFGCFFCMNVEGATGLDDWEWIDKGETPLCPNCGIDSVLPDACPYPVTHKPFLEMMHDKWFDGLHLDD